MKESKPWYTSTIFWSAGLAAIGAALEALKQMPLEQPYASWVISALAIYACLRRLVPQKNLTISG